MTKWLTGLLDRSFAVIGALVCAQAPMFIQQYNQQLTGRVAELKLQMDAMANIATLSQKSVKQYIQRFIDSGDPDFMRQGDILLWTHERYDQLTNALNQLSGASMTSKPFVFLRDLNWEVARSTLSEFQPGIPFTAEGFIYALIGIGIGFGVFFLLITLLRFCCRPFVKRQPTNTSISS